MGATSMKQLEKQMMRQLRKAMQRVATRSESILNEEISGFYSGGSPVMYERTYQLRETPDVSPVASTSTSASFTAKLDNSGRYTTGARPTMEEVLDLTNYGSSPGLRPAVGATGYWERAGERIVDAAEEEIAKAFG